jgi:hypothetical protein
VTFCTSAEVGISSGLTFFFRGNSGGSIVRNSEDGAAAIEIRWKDMTEVLCWEDPIEAFWGACYGGGVQ